MSLGLMEVLVQSHAPSIYVQGDASGAGEGRWTPCSREGDLHLVLVLQNDREIRSFDPVDLPQMIVTSHSISRETVGDRRHDINPKEPII